MSDAAQELQQPEQRAQAERSEPSRPQEAGTIEERIGTGVGRIVTAAGASVRRVSEAIRSRVKGEQAALGGQEGEQRLRLSDSLKIPEEFRGLIERYPLQSLLVSCGAGYMAGSLLSGRRRR